MRFIKSETCSISASTRSRRGWETESLAGGNGNDGDCVLGRWWLRMLLLLLPGTGTAPLLLLWEEEKGREEEEAAAGTE